MTMQGKDMKAIRQEIGLSQAQFADELGMTSTFVGLMERGERPIEKRTALAVWQLAYQQGRQAREARTIEQCASALIDELQAQGVEVGGEDGNLTSVPISGVIDAIALVRAVLATATPA